MNPLERYYEKLEPELREIFFSLRYYILNFDVNISEHLKYGAPFFYYKKKQFCYLYKHKKTKIPYIGIVKGDQIEHEALFQGERKKMKILELNPKEDLPFDKIEEVLHLLIELY